MIDKSKQIYAWHSFDDIDVNCSCGKTTHAGDYDDDSDSYQFQCENCGQRWVVIVQVIPVKENDKPKN